MNTAADIKLRMTVDEFVEWCDARQRNWSGSDEPGWELFDGVPVMQQSERWIHVQVKVALFDAIRRGVHVAGLPVEVAIDSLGVKISERDYVEPDIIVFPAGLIAPDDLFAPAPIIVAEVLSPSTAHVDRTTKLAGYNRVSSIQHYLVLDPDAREIHHYPRASGNLASPEAPASGVLMLDPPGLSFPVDDCFKR